MSAVQIGAMVQQPPEPVAQEFREYPMVLVHPHARRAETIGVPGTEKRDSLGRLIPGVFDQYRGTADFMPPVTVNNYDQEMFHRAQGYERGGNSSHEAFSRMTARGAGPTPEVVEYPKWVDGVLVNDAEQEAALKRMGIDAPKPAPDGLRSERTGADLRRSCGRSGTAPAPRPHGPTGARQPPWNSPAGQATLARADRPCGQVGRCGQGQSGGQG